MTGTTVDAPVIVFAGSYAPAERAGLRAFRLDTVSWTFTEIGGWSGVPDPSFVAISADGTRLYAASETCAADGRPGRVHAFAVRWEGDEPDLMPLGDVPSRGDHPCHLAIDPSGRWLAVSNYGSGSLVVIDLDEHGELGTVRDALQLRDGSVHPDRQRAPHVHSATPTPDGRHLLVADLGGDRLLSLRVEPDRLVECARATVRPGAGPRHSAVRARDRIVVVANELDSTVSTYRIGTEGELTHVAMASTVPAGTTENLVAEVRLSHDGRTVLVSNRGHDSIATFVLHDDGALGERRLRSCGGTWPRHFSVLPGDAHVIVANERSDELVVLPTGPGSTVAAIPMPTPTCVVVYPTAR